VPTPFRRLFHRPSEIVIGYDEQIVAPSALRAAREAWGGDVPVRTMPFNRVEADPTSALMITLGEVGDGERWVPSRAACGAIASALGAATAAPWRFGVRFDHRGVIVRGAAETRAPMSLAAALLALPTLAADARAAIDQWPDEGLHLITAQWNDETRGHWVLGPAHGFKGTKWVKALGSGADTDVPT
jgi:hypothetical protein